MWPDLPRRILEVLPRSVGAALFLMLAFAPTPAGELGSTECASLVPPETSLPSEPFASSLLARGRVASARVWLRHPEHRRLAKRVRASHRR